MRLRSWLISAWKANVSASAMFTSAITKKRKPHRAEHRNYYEIAEIVFDATLVFRIQKLVRGIGEEVFILERHSGSFSTSDFPGEERRGERERQS